VTHHARRESRDAHGAEKVGPELIARVFVGSRRRVRRDDGTRVVHEKIQTTVRAFDVIHQPFHRLFVGDVQSQ
jgi:hypothetical protein